MRQRIIDRRPGTGLLVLAAATLTFSSAATAQDAPAPRELVGRAVLVGSDVARLTLQFDDGGSLAITLEDGRVEVDGSEVGRYDEDDALEQDWRQLLGSTAQLDDVELADRLVAWAPPSDLGGDLLAAAEAIDRALEASLRGVQVVGRSAPTVTPTPPPAPAASAQDEAEWRERVREEVREELARELEGRDRTASRGRDRDGGPLRRVFGGIGGAFANLVSVGVLGLLGFFSLHFARPGFEGAASVVRRRPGQALGIGIAGTFLFLPVFVIGIVALALSIIGIPVLLLWIPAFPAAVTLAALFGYLAVASNLGRWLDGLDLPGMGWLRGASDVVAILAGLFVLAAPFILANLLSVLPFTGALEALLLGTGGMAVAVAMLVGFGAVLVSLAGSWRARRSPGDVE